MRSSGFCKPANRSVWVLCLPRLQIPTPCSSGSFRAVSADLKSEIRASEARREKQIGERKKANEGLAGKLDPLPDAFRAAKA